jgi:hypothetical protein
MIHANEINEPTRRFGLSVRIEDDVVVLKVVDNLAARRLDSCDRITLGVCPSNQPSRPTTNQQHDAHQSADADA